MQYILFGEGQGSGMTGSYFNNEADLISAALSLGARTVQGWSTAEQRLAAGATPLGREVAAKIIQQVCDGSDPLGEAFGRIRSADERRMLGATFTPRSVVSSILKWAEAKRI